MNLNKKCLLHNRFDIVVRDKETGEVKKTAKAYNMVLDNMWTRLVNLQTYFSYIAFGTGTGTLEVTRTSLFTYLGSKAPSTSDDERSYDIENNNIWIKRKIQLSASEFVGTSITEVGISYSSGDGNLVTHALIKDSEGNTVTINKTDSDVVDIYATVYVEINSNPAGIPIICQGSNNKNPLIDYLLCSTTTLADLYIYLGTMNVNFNYNSGPVLAPVGISERIDSEDWISDIGNKKITTPVLRFDVLDANGFIYNICLAKNDTEGVFSLTLPITGVWNSNYALEGMTVGTGDDSKTEFVIPGYVDINQEDIVVYADGVEVVTGYTLKQQIKDTITRELEGSYSYSSESLAYGDFIRYYYSWFSSSYTTYYYNKLIFSDGSYYRKTVIPDIGSTNHNQMDICKKNNEYYAFVAASYRSPKIYKFSKQSGLWDVVFDLETVSLAKTINAYISASTGVCILTGGSSPYKLFYKYNFEANTLETYAPTVVPEIGYGISMSGSHQGNYIISYNTSNFYVYKIETTGEFTQLYTENRDVNEISWDYEEKYFIVTGNEVNGTGYEMYKLESDVVTKHTLLESEKLAGEGQSCSFAPDNQGKFIIIHGTNISFCEINYTSDAITVIRTIETGTDPYEKVLYGKNKMIFTSGLTGGSGFHYIDYSHNETIIEFDTAPALNSIITADGSINYIPKDENHVLDVSCSITFGEGTP